MSETLVSCRATRRNLLLALVIALLLLAARARAEPVAATVESPAKDQRLVLEYKPLAWLAGLSPGASGLGVALEARVQPHLSVYADVYHLRLRLSDKAVGEAQTEKAGTGDEGVAQDTAVTTAGLGLRYYGNPTGDSWYTGLKLGAGPSRIEWAYGNDRWDDRRFGYNGTAEAGYLWIWDSGLLVRLGGGITWSAVSSREIIAASEQSLATVPAALEGPVSHGASVTTVFDFGIGVAL